MTNQFKAEIIRTDISFMTSKWIIEKVPFVFEGNLEQYIKWKEIFANKIGVDSKAIVLTGQLFLPPTSPEVLTHIQPSGQTPA